MYLPLPGEGEQAGHSSGVVLVLIHQTCPCPGWELWLGEVSGLKCAPCCSVSQQRQGPRVCGAGHSGQWLCGEPWSHVAAGRKHWGQSGRSPLPCPSPQAALQHGVIAGRRGFGSIFVVASGNGGQHSDNCNYDGYANSIYTVTIGEPSVSSLPSLEH